MSVNCNKCTTVGKMLIARRLHVQEQRFYGNFLYFLFNFALNQNLLFKNYVFKVTLLKIHVLEYCYFKIQNIYRDTKYLY